MSVADFLVAGGRVEKCGDLLTKRKRFLELGFKQTWGFFWSVSRVLGGEK